MNRGCLGGCLGGFVLVVIVLLVGGYFLVYQPARNFITQAQEFTRGFSLPGTGTTGTSAPAQVAPASLSQADVRKFVRVRRAIRSELGDAFTPLSKTLDQTRQGGNPSLADVVNALRQVGGKLGDARRVQQTALEQEKLSPARYAAIRSQVNRALGVPEVDWQQVGQALQTLQAPDFQKAVKPADPRAQQLVAPFRKELEATAALGLIGL